jgi:hypothetical protein
LFDSKEVSVYPNPANNQFNIEGKNLDQASVFVYNQIGQQLSLKHTKQDNKLQFDCSNVVSGVYFVKVVFTDGQSVVRKINIEK